MNQGLPWPVAIIPVVMFLGFGCAYLFFTDHLCDWQIKLLKSRRLRRSYRIMGAIFVVGGLAFAWAFATHSFS